MRSRLVQVGFLASLAFCSSANAADLVVGGTVTKVSNTSSNLSLFGILVTGGSLNLCAPSWISFPVSAAPDADTHKRAYANALLALTTGMQVRVHNYNGSDCVASYIEVIASP